MSKNQTAKQSKNNQGSTPSPQRILSTYKKLKRTLRGTRFGQGTDAYYSRQARGMEAQGSMHRVALEATAKTLSITLGEAQELLLQGQAEAQGITLEQARANSLREREERQRRYELGTLAREIYRAKVDQALEDDTYGTGSHTVLWDEAWDEAQAQLSGN